MLFDMGLGELLAIGVLGLVVFGPDRLPRVAAQAAQLLRQLRDQANDAKASIIEAADIDATTLKEIRDLDPRRALRDIASPLEDARRSATDAMRIDNIPKRPASAPAPSAPAEPAAPAPEPKQDGIIHDDIA